jgi:hypothetical protein
MKYPINRWLAIVVMSILVTVASVETVLAAPMITDNNSYNLETMDPFAYKDSNIRLVAK